MAKTNAVRLRVEVGEALYFLHYPDGQIMQTTSLSEVQRLINAWQPAGMTRWQRLLVWVLCQGPITLVQAGTGRAHNIPPQWMFGD